MSEANRYVGEARKRPAGARIWGPEILVVYIKIIMVNKYHGKDKGYT